VFVGDAPHSIEISSAIPAIRSRAAFKAGCGFPIMDAVVETRCAARGWDAAERYGWRDVESLIG